MSLVKHALSSYKCNSSLSDNFPGSKLQRTISNEEGTIGDWLRNSEEDIIKLAYQ